MLYRPVPHCPEIQLSVVGFGAANLHDTKESRELLHEGLEAGINFMDTLPSEGDGYQAIHDVVAPARDHVYVQLHLGCDYSSGAYGWTRDLDAIKRDWDRQLGVFETDYADFGFIHCMDEVEDYDSMLQSGLWDYALELKRTGAIRHLGCSTHNVEIARRFVATGKMDLMMFSINPMYDYTDASEYGQGGACERADLYRLCEARGVALSVMKFAAGGQLLSADRSPFGIALTPAQCLQYALDKPGVVSVLAGMASTAELRETLSWLDAPAELRDYSVLGGIVPAETAGRCVYCSHCHPCPAGLDIAMINKYYDLALVGDELARSHYDKLALHAGDCLSCGHCDARCPFGVAQSARMEEIAAYFGM